MAIRRTSSAETAARFTASFAKRRPFVRVRRRARRAIPAPAPVVAPRKFLDLAPGTFAEVLDCVVERVWRYEQAGKPVPHITRIALKMLHEATAER
jgi:hypothetical protein